MTSKQIRQKYLDFFTSKAHTIIPSSSLIPENDSTTLFTGSGMQSLIPYLLGEQHPRGARLVNAQKCFRAEDIEEVGDNRHNTFFEMLGNWSLGDYFKQEQLKWIFEFLTQELKIDANRIYITVFNGNKKYNIPKDAESVEIWKNIFQKAGIEAGEVSNIFNKKTDKIDDGRNLGTLGVEFFNHHIFYYDEKKNWWSRSGTPDNMPIGEIGGADSEIFYDLGSDLGLHEKSKFKNQQCHINCDCGRFIEIGNNVFIEYVKTKDGFKKLPQKNVDFGGGLERITMICQNKINVFKTDLFYNIINRIEQLTRKKYEENMKPFEIIADHIKAATFIIGDDQGVIPSNIGQGYLVRRLIRRAVRYGRQIQIAGTDSNGWTKEIVKVVIHDYADIYPELCKNADFIINEFQKEEKKFSNTLERGLREFKKISRQQTTNNRQQEKSKFTASNLAFSNIKQFINSKDAFNLYQTYGFPIEITKELAEEKGIKVDEDGFKQELKKHQELSKTASAGKFKGGLVDTSEQTKKLHTATHLLLAALRRILGDHIVQRGSNITTERLRFDFLHKDKLTEQQKQKVENLINQAIKQDLEVKCEEMSVDQAKQQGALGIFDSKYGDKVKVYTIGEQYNIFSKEICNGPHVKQTGQLGEFKIIKEQSSSAGVRRIKAIIR